MFYTTDKNFMIWIRKQQKEFEKWAKKQLKKEKRNARQN